MTTYSLDYLTIHQSLYVLNP